MGNTCCYYYLCYPLPHRAHCYELPSDISPDDDYHQDEEETVKFLQRKKDRLLSPAKIQNSKSDTEGEPGNL